jgi:5-(carboxyamino)imidazole ribonucleotide synthase
MSPAQQTPPELAPGDTIGILGGGQLGRMLAMSAASLGLDVAIFCPEADSPASRVSADSFVAPYDDEAQLTAFARRCSVVTLEFENIPVSAIDVIEAAGVRVRPGRQALAVSQDRLVEKTFFQSIGIAPAPFVRIDRVDDIAPGLTQLGGAGVLKTRRSGYDGKGQARIASAADGETAFLRFGGAECVLEAFIPFRSEMSVVLARGLNGEIRTFDPSDNRHQNGILRSSTFPSSASPSEQEEALRLTARLAEALDYVGVLALEFFLTADGRLLANEFAPRVHNSGHWTARACRTGQFEQHIRAVCGWPLGDVDRFADGEMENLLGDEAGDWRRLMRAGDSVELYGKRAASDGRKMGHVVRFSAPRRRDGR